ncbi:PAS domain-containing protein [Pedobacter frigidisoli]|uniref:PAS domain-containing protein n=1 Tax=Pedobacter frigidisoli TaxID=2530455 RepID=UPI00292D6778|nr:PAS domain-containing protein [Pedobacter frigidisoli]
MTLFTQDNLYTSPAFQDFFKSSPRSLVLSADAPRFTILAVSDQFINLVGKTRSELLGKGLFEVFPGNKAESPGQNIIEASFERVIQTGKPDKLEAFSSEILVPGTYQRKSNYFSSLNEPVADDEGKVSHLINSTKDVTEQIGHQDALKEALGRDEALKVQQAFNEQLDATNKKLAAANDELSVTNEELLQTHKKLYGLNQELENRVRQRTAELTEERDKLIRFFMDSPVGICIFAGPELVFELVNPNYKQLLPDREVLGRPVFEALPEIQGQLVGDMLRRVFFTGNPMVENELQVPLMTHDGAMVDRYFNLNFLPRHDTNGKIDGVMAFVLEVTPIVEARRRSEQSEHDLRALVMTSHYPLMILRGREYLIDIANEQLADLWDKPLNSVLGHRLLDVLPEIADQPFPKLLKQVYDTGIGYGQEEQVFYLNTDNGIRTKYVSFYYDPLKGENGEVSGIIVAASDITKMVNSRQLLEESYEVQKELNEKITATNEELLVFNRSVTDLNRALFESEKRFRIMAEGTDVMIAVGDESGAAVYFNKAWEEVTGRTTADLINYGWADLMHPDDQLRVMKIFTEAFQQRNPWEWEFRMPNRKDEYIWLLARGTPRFSADESFVGYISSCIDITSRKLEEERKNDFISMVSHELKTPITSMSAYVQMLQLRARKNADTFSTNALSKTYDQIKKMPNMINGFLNVSRLDSGKINIDKTRFDMAQLLTEVEEESLATTHSHDIIFGHVRDAWISADRDKIGQVIHNFISNAVKYSAVGTVIDVACVFNNNEAHVSVKDHGIGIEPEDQARLFDRFFRVENPQTRTVAGFGIGLYLCAEIIKLHNGRIWVESEAGNGSTFNFSIPLGNS